MNGRDKIGLIILLGLVALLFVVFIWVTDRPDGPGRPFEDSAIVRQRMINLQK